MSSNRKEATHDDAGPGKPLEGSGDVDTWHQQQLVKRHMLADQGDFADPKEAERLAARFAANG